MIDYIDKISLSNMSPAPWTAYVPFVIGIFGLIVLFSAIVLIVSWARKRKAEPLKSEDE